MIAAAALAGTACGSSPRWNLLLVTFDTTRADHIGAWGNDTIATPHLDRLAVDGVRFARAFSTIPLTTPSHATILTGKYPFGHGIRDNGTFVLPQDQLTLAEILSAEGYDTAAAVGAFPLVARFGLGQGFDLFDDRVAVRWQDLHGERVVPTPSLFFDERRAGLVNEAILPWLRERDERPFFAWIHYYDPHQPLEPPPPFDQLYADDPYDGEIAYADESIGVVLRHLEELGLDDRTIVVFAADHGEGLGEHQEATHSHLLYNATLHVPLIVRAPGGRSGAVVEESVGTVDILPTVLDLLGVDAPDGLHGRSLAHHVAPRRFAEQPPTELYAESLAPRFSHGWGELRAIIEGPHKLIYGPRPELYDIEADPRELEDLAGREPEIADRLEARLAWMLRELGASSVDAAVEIDEEARRKLAALGYIGGAGSSEVLEEKLRADGIPPQDRAADVSRWSLTRQLLFQNQPLAARDAILPLVQRDPGDPVYLDLLALAEIELGRHDEAAAHFETMLAHNDPALLQPRVPLALAGNAFARGDLAGAKAYAAAAEQIRATGEGAYLRALIAQRNGDAVAHQAALEQTLALDPGYAPARVSLAVVHAGQGRRAEAEALLRQAIADQPYFPRAWYNLGVVHYERQMYEGALPFFRRAVRLDPGYVLAHFALVDSLVRAGHAEEARAAYRELAAVAPGSEEEQTARGLLEGLR